MDSSWIEHYAYAPSPNGNGILSIQTKDNTTYSYKDVPPSHDKGMKNAESRGAYHNENLRGKFTCVKS